MINMQIPRKETGQKESKLRCWRSSLVMQWSWRGCDESRTCFCARDVWSQREAQGVWRVWRLRSSYRRQFNASMFFFTYLHSSLQLQIIKHQHMYQYVSIFQHLAAQNQHIQSLQTIKNGLKPRYTWSILKYDLWTCHILFPSFPIFFPSEIPQELRHGHRRGRAMRHHHHADSYPGGWPAPGLPFSVGKHLKTSCGGFLDIWYR